MFTIIMEDVKGFTKVVKHESHPPQFINFPFTPFVTVQKGLPQTTWVKFEFVKAITKKKLLYKEVA